jgi:CRISPR-associated protein Csm1
MSAHDTFGLRFAFDATPMPDAHYVLALEFTDPVASMELPVADDIPGIRYTVSKVPEGSFDDLGDMPTFLDSQQREHGIKRLGILRMDVDNLSDIFKGGLGKLSTLPRIASLSRAFSTFFEGRVAELCRNVTDMHGQSAIYPVYSGGDDVFLVGPWHLMPKLAVEIRTGLNALTLNHPDIHVSAGIALVGKKFPLYRAAEDSHNALESAKAIEGKNAICFLENPLAWSEFDKVAAWAGKFIDNGIRFERDFPMSLLRVLISLETTRSDVERDHPEQKVGRWVWTGVYQLHRLMEQYQKRGNPAIAALIGEVKLTLQQENFAQLPILGMAAQWAHLVLRRSEQE